MIDIGGKCASLHVMFFPDKIPKLCIGKKERRTPPPPKQKKSQNHCQFIHRITGSTFFHVPNL